MKGYDYLSFLARFFHLKELEELSLRSAPSGVEEVKADTSVNTYARVLALTPKPTCRLITPLNERFVVSLSILLLLECQPFVSIGQKDDAAIFESVLLQYVLQDMIVPVGICT